MKKKTLLLLLFDFMLLFTGCGDNAITPDRYMVLDDVEYVNTFPKTYTLSDRMDPEIDIIGMNDFCVLDSMIAFSTRGGNFLWTFISLPDYAPLGSFLTNGDGPFEFVQTPRVSFKTCFYKEKGQLYAGIYDFQKGKLFKMNVDASLDSDTLHMSVMKDSLPPFLFSFVMMDSLHYFCKEANMEQTQQIRYVIGSNGERTVPSVMQRLNRAQVSENEDINIISAISKMNTENSMMVEMPIGLNYINMYSLDDSSCKICKTVCIGNELDDIKDIEDKVSGNRVYTYADLRLYEDFWGVVFINEDMKTYQTGRKKLPSILLFNWDGKPLAELKLPYFITSFDIDFAAGELYTFDVHTDEFFKYDIGNILKELKTTGMIEMEKRTGLLSLFLMSDVFEIYEMAGRERVRRVYVSPFKSVPQIQKRGERLGMDYENSIAGFMSMSASSELIGCSFSSQSYAEATARDWSSDEILCFDWDGRKVKNIYCRLLSVSFVWIPIISMAFVT